jgi:hypothetical protein
VSAVRPRIIGDLVVALRAYANFADGPGVAAASPAQSSLEPAIIVRELQSLGFANTPTASKTIVALTRNDLVVYVRLNSPDSFVVHPAFEEVYSVLARSIDLTRATGVRFYHNSNMIAFPKRDNGRGLTHYGIPFAFANRDSLCAFVGELQGALTLTSPIARERTLRDEIKGVETEAVTLRKARIGQGRFRADLLNFWQGQCAITGVYAPELLRASHIKPWRDGTNQERLDTFNGLLLAVHLDALFDCALITFLDSGEMRMSKALSTTERNAFGLNAAIRKLPLSAPHVEYLRHHQARFNAGERAK